jgi:hypothetical protein
MNERKEANLKNWYDVGNCVSPTGCFHWIIKEMDNEVDDKETSPRTSNNVSKSVILLFSTATCKCLDITPKNASQSDFPCCGQK